MSFVSTAMETKCPKLKQIKFKDMQNSVWLTFNIHSFVYRQGCGRVNQSRTWKEGANPEKKEERKEYIVLYDTIPVRACQNWEKYWTTQVCRSPVGIRTGPSEWEFIALLLWQPATVYDSLFLCLFNYAFSNALAMYRRMLGCIVFSELERMWKEPTAASLRYYPIIWLERLRKTMKNLSQPS
jgi:hypothetical protein